MALARRAPRCGPVDTGVDAGRTGLKRAEPGRPGRVRVRSLAARAAAVLLAAVAALLALPLQAQAQTTVWSSTLTVRLMFGTLGCSNGVEDSPCSTYLSDDDFTHDSTDYAITTIWVRTNGRLEFHLDTDLTTATQALTLNIDGTAFAFEDADSETSDTRSWNNSGLSWTAGDSVSLTLTEAAPANSAPVFASATVTREVAENTAAGQNVGAAVTATDADSGDTLTYTLGGTDMASFQLSTTVPGQIQTKSGVTYDHEAKGTYTVTVTASDGTASAVATVTISVTDEDEPPAAPAAPTVSAVSGSTTSLLVSWTAPANSGKPDIASYDLQYREGTSGSFTDGPQNVTGTSSTITGLTAGTLYQVQVRATNAEGDSAWSTAGSGTTNSQVATCTAPTDGIWGACLTVKDLSGSLGCNNSTTGAHCSTTSVLTDDDFTHAGTAYSITRIRQFTNGVVQLWFDVSPAAEITQQLLLEVDGIARSNPSFFTGNLYLQWGIVDTSRWAEGDTVALALKEANNVPVFALAEVIREVAENTAAGENVGAAVTATDADTGDTLTYTLRGADMASFQLSTTVPGQIQTKSGVTYDHEAKDTYEVTVTASDGTDSANATVTINVTDVNEPPAAPAAPTVSAVSGSTTSLSVNWTAPANSGKPDITSYDLQYREGTSGDWTNGPQDATGTSSTITGLTAGTLYQVQVRATNAEGDSGWSAAGSGTTNATTTPTTNNAPVFDPAAVSRSVAENTAAGRNVGAAVTATDADSGDTLTYSLDAGDGASFEIVSGSGQIQTKSGVTYDHEATASYSVTVTASDGTASAEATVTISVTDVDEPPARPAAPSVSSVAGSTTRLSVMWTAPANTGPAIDTYDLRYRPGTSGSWINGPQNVSGTNATISGLTANTLYQVQVQATSGEGDSPWSPPGSGQTNTAGNTAPTFSSQTASRSVAENSAAGTNVGAPVTATDADSGDTLTYTLDGTDAASFDIVSTSGQIQTMSGVTYDYETKSSYAVIVKADDGNGGSDTIMVTITVTDVDESPSPGPEPVPTPALPLLGQLLLALGLTAAGARVIRRRPRVPPAA